MMKLAEGYKAKYSSGQEDEMSLEEYLELCRKDPGAYSTAAERMLAAIGEPELVDTRLDQRLSRIFSNRLIKRYPAFAEFYGMEDAISQIVAFFKHAAQGLEEKKQILYLLGPVGGGKSSIAERLKQLMERQPIYALKGSPVNESPLGLVCARGIRRRARVRVRHPAPLSHRHHVAVGDQAAAGVRRRYLPVPRGRASSLPCCARSAIAKTEPGDENNQDISSLVGKVDIRKLDKYAQDDPDAYSYSGGLCLANQGLLEFVEMFKAPIKMLHPLLTATQEGQLQRN